MLDDDEQKIRRNLVVFSVAIILVAWFDIPITSLASSILRTNGSTPPVHISSLKAWWAALAILSYLAFRFRFTSEIEQMARETLDTFANRRKQAAETVAYALKHRGQDPSEWPELADQVEAHMAKRGEKAMYPDRGPFVELMHCQSKPPYRVARAVVEIRSFGKTAAIDEAGFDVTLRTREFWLVRVAAFFRTWVYSKVAVERRYRSRFSSRQRW
jgi:hypothetical protein